MSGPVAVLPHSVEGRCTNADGIQAEVPRCDPLLLAEGCRVTPKYRRVRALPRLHPQELRSPTERGCRLVPGLALRHVETHGRAVLHRQFDALRPSFRAAFTPCQFDERIARF